MKLSHPTFRFAPVALILAGTLGCPPPPRKVELEDTKTVEAAPAKTERAAVNSNSTTGGNMTGSYETPGGNMTGSFETPGGNMTGNYETP